MAQITLTRYKHVLKRFVRRANVNIALYQAENTTEYRRFREAVEKTLNKQVKHIIDNPLYMQQIFAVRKYDAPEEIKTVISRLWVGNEFDTRFNELTRYGKLSFYINAFATIGGQEALDKLGIEALFNLRNAELVTMLREYETVMVGTLDKVTRNYIGQKIADGTENFLTPDETASLIASELPGVNQNRAELIVRTETARAVSMTQVETFKRNGITQKEWMTSRDERVCPICGPLHGQVIGIDDAFNGKDGNGNKFIEEYPPIHPRCRCDILEVIPDDYIENDKYFIGE